MDAPHILDAAIAALEAGIAAGQMPPPYSDDVWAYNGVGDGVVILVGHGDHDDSDWLTVRMIGAGPPGRRVWVDIAVKRADVLVKDSALGAMLRESWDMQVDLLTRSA